jgi:hypothetical protein
MTNYLSYVGNKETLISLIDLAIKKRVFKFSKYSYNGAFKSLFEKWINDCYSDKTSIITNCCYVVNNLD